MPLWTVAGVQMDCTLSDTSLNLRRMTAKLTEAADRGAKFIVFPECALTGYGFESRDHAKAAAEPIPGPAVRTMAEACAKLGVFAAFGMLEAAEGKLYNACALVGPEGFIASYRKTHLPCLGADRFTDPGNGPFTVHDLGGLKVGLSICFDGSFPEVARMLTLDGADLIVLPTNWATGARKMAELAPMARAWENHIYFLAVNRVGDESGHHYIGHSSAADYLGNLMHVAPDDVEAIFTVEIDPAAAARKRVVSCPGTYEIDRVNWRRPELYGRLVEPAAEAFKPHFE